MAWGGRRGFAVSLLLIVVAAFGLRAFYATVGTVRPERSLYDWEFYRGEARSIAYGGGFVQPGFTGMPPKNSPATASHPPLFPILLAPISRVSGDRSITHNDLALRLFNCVLGALAVGLIGLLARELAGDAAGVLAAAIAAIYPNLWVNDGLIMSETLDVGLIAGALLAAVSLVRRRSMKAAIALAVLCGLGALARGELILMFPLLCLPAVYFASIGDAKRRLQLLGVSVLAVVVVIGPWVGYNLTRFEKPVFISTNFDLTLAGSSCRDVMSGRFLGTIGFCVKNTIQPGGDESVTADKYRAAAIKNIKHYIKRYPIVLAARVGRTWSLYRVADSVRFGTTDGRPEWVSTLGLVAFYPLALLAIAGAWIRRRRRELLWPLLVPPVIVTLASIIAFGSVRYRTSAEPVIVVLAAIALTSPDLWRRLRSRRAEVPAVPETPVPVA